MAQAIQPSSETELTRLDAEHQEQIEACVERTQWSVKAVDVATGLVSLAAGIVAYLLLLTLVDHWVVSLSTSLRFAALVVLLLGVASFLGVWFVPIVVREVNPLYAARVIEQSAPSLKNSLLNLLLLSRRPEAVRPMIFSGLRRQAAEQIATLPQGSPVDHGPLIVAGYWLAGLVAVAATYKLLSPKDPFQSAARVVAPWEAIERPARVRIAEVRPGDTSVYRGQTLEVTATLQGLREDETAEVVLSAPDGRPPRVLALRAVGGDARTFTASMRLDDQDLPGEMNYHLRAGDARSRDFRLELLDAPHIAVESVTYEYPAYTGLAPRQDSQSGDLVAVEGTRVRITARANQPIQDAYLELFAPASDKAAGKLEGAGGSRASEESNTQTRPVQALPMQVVASGGASHEAQGRLTLLLDKNRSSSPFTAYQLRFKNSRGDTSDEAVRHRIQVTADLAPVVEILAPLDREVRVPLYGRMQFEVRALDPDFALSAVRLRGTQAEVARWNESLLAKAPHSGQFTRKVTLVPARLGLKPGQELMVWAEADDNRQSIAGAAEPNTTRTAAWRVLVTEPEAKPNRGDGEGEGDQASSRPGDSKSAEENEAGEGQGGSEQGGSEQGGSEQGGSEQGGSEQGGSEQGGSEQGGSEQGGSEQGGSEQGGSEQGGEGNESGEGTGDSSGEASAGAEPGKENGKGASGASPQGDPAGESTAEASPEESGGDSTGQSGAGDAGEQSSEAASPSEESNPLPSDGSRDGDAFERILKRMREQNSGSGGEGEEGATPEESSEDVGGGGKSPAGQKPQASSRDATRQRTPKEPSGEGTAADDGTSSGGDATGNSDKRSADDESGPSESPESGTPSNSQGRGKPKSSGTGTSTRPKTSAGTDGEAAQAGVEDANADDPRASDAGDADTGTAGDSSQGAGQGNQGTGSDSRTGERSSTGSESESSGASSNRGEQNATDGPSEGAPGSAEAGNERSQSPDARANEATEGGSPSPAQGAASKTPEAGAEGAEGSAESDSSVGDPSGARPPEAVSDGAEETADGDAEAGPRGANDAGKQGSRGSQGRAGARPEASDGEATAGDLANPEGEKGGGQPAAGAEGSSRPEASSAKGSEPSKEAPTPNGDDAGEERVGDSAGPSRGGGQGGRAEGETLDAAAPTADEANLEYANKATAMALEYLKDRPQDGELLERLGWTPAEMKAFVDRWQRMRSATGAERDRGGQAAERLNDQLRGLGLRPPNARVRSNRQPKDAGATLRQGGAASVLPSEYQEQFRAFLKSVPEPSRSGAAERPRGSQ